MNFLFAVLRFVTFSLEGYDELPTHFGSFFGVLESNLEYQTQRDGFQSIADVCSVESNYLNM